MPEERLQKVLARAGISSRRSAEELILKGRVSVDGKIVRELGVRADLYTHWDMDQENFSSQVDGRVARATAKAWRFEGEMKEIAATLRDAGVPGEFHSAAAEVFHRMAVFKDRANNPSLDEVIQALLAG